MVPRQILAAAGAIAILSTPAAAQLSVTLQPDTTPPTQLALRSSASFAIMQLRPRGQLAANIGLGYGGTAAYMYRVDTHGWLALRVEGGFGGYGSETRRVPLSETIGGRVLVDVRTSNMVVLGSVGPQVMVPRGPVRPYASVGIGLQYFTTSTSVHGVSGSDDQGHFSTNNHGDGTRTLMAGWGVLIPLAVRPAPAQLDIGATWYLDGTSSYLRPGSIRDLPGGRIEISPLRSRTDMAVVRLGLRIGR
jgi:hypothetical protein